jgi:hypothetical protein
MSEQPVDVIIRGTNDAGGAIDEVTKQIQDLHDQIDQTSTAIDDAQTSIQEIPPEAEKLSSSVRGTNQTVRELGYALNGVGMGGSLSFARMAIALGPIAIAVAALGSAIGLVSSSMAAAFKDTEASGLGAFKTAIEEISNVWRGFQYAVAQTLGAAILPHVEAIKNAFSVMVQALSPLLPVLAQIAGWLAGAIANAMLVVSKIIVGLILGWWEFKRAVAMASNAVNQLVYILEVGVITAFNTVKSVIMAVVNSIVDAINDKIIGGINSLIAQANALLPDYLHLGTITFRLQHIYLAPTGMPNAPQMINPDEFAGPMPTFNAIPPAAAPVTTTPAGGGGGGGGGGTKAKTTKAAKTATTVGGTAARPQIDLKTETVIVVETQDVSDKLDDLIAAMNKMPVAVRDAVVVYTGA